MSRFVNYESQYYLKKLGGHFVIFVCKQSISYLNLFDAFGVKWIQKYMVTQELCEFTISVDSFETSVYSYVPMLSASQALAALGLYAKYSTLVMSEMHFFL